MFIFIKMKKKEIEKRKEGNEVELGISYLKNCNW